MDKIVIILLILLVVVGIVFFILIKKKGNEEVTYKEEEKTIRFSQNDINMINNINDRVITGKKRESKLNIPDFDKSKPIGYKDLSHIESTYGDRVANTNNQNTK